VEKLLTQSLNPDYVPRVSLGLSPRTHAFLVIRLDQSVRHCSAGATHTQHKSHGKDNNLRNSSNLFISLIAELGAGRVDES
jgi:hypothetical protein